MNETIELLRRIESKLEEIDRRLKRIEEELFDELSEEEIREIKEIVEACKTGKLRFEVITSAKAVKDIKKLDKTTRIRIYKEIQKLEDVSLPSRVYNI